MRRCLPLLSLISVPAAAGTPATVCLGDATTASISIAASDCDYAQISDALIAQETSIVVYRPNSGAAYDPFIVNYSVTITGVEGSAGGLPRVAATVDSAAVETDCLGCTLTLEDLELEANARSALVSAGATTILTRVEVRGTDFATDAPPAIQLLSGEIDASDGGLQTVLQGIRVDDGSMRWTRGTVASDEGRVALVVGGSLEFNGGEIFAPGSLTGLQVDGTGTLSLTNFAQLSGTSEDGGAGRSAGSLVSLGSGLFACVDSGISDGNGTRGSLVQAFSDAVVSFDGCTLEDAVATEDGALLHAENVSSVTSVDTVWQNGEARNGGAVKLINVDDASFTRDWFDQNRATGQTTGDGHGGAIGSIATALTLTDAEFSFNDAEFEGGALYSGIGGGLNVTNGNFRDNTSFFGGAISSQGVWVTIDGTDFVGNDAAFDGGALAGDSFAVWRVSNASFRINTAGGDGGAIASAASSSGWISHSFFCDNQASDAGGAIYSFIGNIGGVEPWNNLVFFRNTAFALGGAAYLDGSDVSIGRATFATNEAPAGGSLYADFGATLGMTGSLLTHTVAGDGARIGGNTTPQISLAGRAFANEPQTAGGGVVNSMLELSATPFFNLDESAPCNEVSWVVIDETVGGATTGTEPFFPDSAVDWDGDGASADEGDCNDLDPEIGPHASELCGNEVDEDCDNATDEADAANAITQYPDLDGDGYGDDDAAVTGCPQAGLTEIGGDCNDDAVAINPGANETCDELDTDEDCNGFADDDDAGNVRGGLSTFYADDDLDGYTGDRTVSRCDSTAQYLVEPTEELDCNDGVAAINPGADEVCDELGTDEDCDTLVNEDDPSLVDATTVYVDADGDGFGSEVSVIACAGDGYVDNADDCDDTNADVNPDAVEDYSTPVDEDCDGNCCDEDGDSYPNVEAAGPGDLVDCNDEDPSIFPGATDIPGDGIDQNCMGEDAASAVGGGCGCQTAPTPALWWVALPVLGLARRRR